MTRTSTPIAMTIAGSDSSGGAGIQADLKTFTTLGIYGVSALTCVVAEHPGRVAAIEPVTPKLLAQQIALNFEVFPVVAAKTGMLYSKELVKAVVDSWKATKQRPKLVVDPVMVSSSGTKLLKDDAIKYMVEKLFPLATLITPNLDEAAVLWGEPIPTLPAMREAAFTLQQRYGCSVLVKGGHMVGELAIDILAEPQTVSTFEAPYRKGVNTHGTGCTLSAAITAVLAKGANLEQAVRSSKKFVTRAITRAIRVGPFSVLNHLPATL